MPLRELPSQSRLQRRSFHSFQHFWSLPLSWWGGHLKQDRWWFLRWLPLLGPAATLGAPQTIWRGSPLPISTLVRLSLSALGCFSVLSTSPIISPFNPPQASSVVHGFHFQANRGKNPAQTLRFYFHRQVFAKPFIRNCHNDREDSEKGEGPIELQNPDSVLFEILNWEFFEISSPMAGPIKISKSYLSLNSTLKARLK